ncbi:MAG: hypothetical protein JW751_08685 [Polyangiaceae bacterium]|nr:hypothetical protein [Polyangiaceae bacterium]
MTGGEGGTGGSSELIAGGQTGGHLVGGGPTGGTISGGAGTGGGNSGGQPIGGTATGGAATGGTAIGATTSSGGTTTGGGGPGGTTTGGMATGGRQTGGAPTGGVSAGGEQTGGADTGGLGDGGTGGLGDGGAEAGGSGGFGTGGGDSGGTGGASVCGVPAPGPLLGWAAVAGEGVDTTTGGGDAPPVTVSNAIDFGSHAGGTTSEVICVQGEIDGDLSIGSNKTIIGMPGARIRGSIHMSGSVNVILRNLQIVGKNCSDSPSDCGDGADAINVTRAHHLWFDHDAVSDGSDGNLDITHASNFITVSWTKFSYSTRRTDTESGASGHRFSNLIGHTDNNESEDGGKLNVTFHHVWWADNVDQRMPRMRYGKIHVFNSLYTATGNNYCIGVGQGASVRSEDNVFIGVNTPVNTTSFVDGASTVTSVGNLYTDITGNPVTDIGTAFDPPYDFPLDPASSVEDAVRSGAGPE